METSCACDSRKPAAVMRTNCALVRSSSMLGEPVSPMPERRPPTSCGTIAESDPLYGTFPSIPSGTSFETSSASSWK